MTLEEWRRYYNEDRPRGAIGNKSPITLMNPGDAPGTSPSPRPGNSNPGWSRAWCRITNGQTLDQNEGSFGGQVSWTYFPSPFFPSVRYLSNQARIAEALAAACEGRAAMVPWLAPGTLTKAVGTPLICSAA